MSPITGKFSFERIISPISFEDFLASFYEKQILAIHRRELDYYDHLVTLDVLKNFLEARPPHISRVMATSSQLRVSRDMYLRADKRVDVARLSELFSNGASLVFRQMQDSIQSLATLCRSAEQKFNWGFQTNLYLTPPRAQGLDIHHDTHDVFVLQVSGSKVWRIYSPTTQLPLPGQHFSRSAVGSVIRELKLNAGDTLYCPRGFPHEAISTDEPSLHISLGSIGITWAEVMIETMAYTCLNDSFFRRNVPPGFASNPKLRASIQNTFSELVERFSEIASFEPALEGIAERFVESCHDPSANLRRDYFTLQPDTIVGGKLGLIYRLIERGHEIVVQYGSLEIEFSSDNKDALYFALDTPNYKVRDLPIDATLEEKIEILAPLLHHGLIVYISD